MIKFLISFGDYENKELTKIIVLAKNNVLEIFKDIGHWIAQDLKENKLIEKISDFYLVPIPLTKTKLLNRGFNQSLILCQTIAEKTGLKVFTNLEKIKETKDQASLKYQERLTNLENAFQVIGSSPQKIILIDDIKTTGSTLKECAKALKKKGAKQVLALTILK